MRVNYHSFSTFVAVLAAVVTLGQPQGVKAQSEPDSNNTDAWARSDVRFGQPLADLDVLEELPAAAQPLPQLVPEFSTPDLTGTVLTPPATGLVSDDLPVDVTAAPGYTQAFPQAAAQPSVLSQGINFEGVDIDNSGTGADVDTAAPPTATDDAPVEIENNLEPGDPSTPTQGEPTPGEPVPGAGDTPTGTPPGAEPRVLISEVEVEGVEGSVDPDLLLEEVYNAISLRAGETTTRTELEADINAIFATGFFSNVQFRPEDTDLGVRVTFIVQPNPVLTRVETADTTVLPEEVVQDAFAPQYGQILNFNDLQAGIETVTDWYQENGYVLAQVVSSSDVTSDGVVTLVVAEGVIEDLEVRFFNAEGSQVDEDGEPIEGRTKPYIVLREFATKPGDVFNRDRIQEDLQRVFGLGIFEDVGLALDPAPENPREVLVGINVVEGNTGSIGAGAGFSSSTGVFGTVSYQQNNLFGRNYRAGAELTLGADALLFDVNLTNPWIKGDPFRTSYTVNAFRRRSISLIFDGGPTEVDLPNGDTPRIRRTGGGFSFSRPLSRDVFNPAVFNASLGLQYQRVEIIDEEGDSSPVDRLGNDLTFSGDDADDLLLVQFGISRDLRNNRVQPTAGSRAQFNVDQSIPVGNGSIFMNRLRATYSHYFPINLLRFTAGCRKQEDRTPTDCPQTLAFNVQGGTVLGDLPPYEAFALGGSNSVRGYGEGELGSGRSFVQATVEYRFPVFSIIGGALFLDAATDLGTAGDVPGEPAIIRDKPGSGFGGGVGVRVRSPLGPIRVDYGINDEGDGRVHFGIGERF